MSSALIHLSNLGFAWPGQPELLDIDAFTLQRGGVLLAERIVAGLAAHLAHAVGAVIDAREGVLRLLEHVARIVGEGHLVLALERLAPGIRLVVARTVAGMVAILTTLSAREWTAIGVAVVVLATVFNTVRMQALSQREEIGVARLVGATESFVRRPFLYLGALSGAVASLLGEIGSMAKLHKSKVEQAGFAVLKAPDIPSVLVETAFISNPDEERRLNDPKYQDDLADALVRGIVAYFAKNPPLARNRQI